jgi:hypothetical protein
MNFKYDLHDTENNNYAFCANDPRKLTLEAGVTFPIVVTETRGNNETVYSKRRYAYK